MVKSLPLRKSLFWDTDTAKIDIKRNADFIIGRVFDFGNLKEWKAIRDFYGMERIKKAAKRHIFLVRETLIFGRLRLKFL